MNIETSNLVRGLIIPSPAAAYGQQTVPQANA